jgi:very-short-patch-repair endonuclease
MSASEQVLWRTLRRKGTGFSFRRQVPIGPYFLDFFCAEAGLCVEVDGEQHLDRPDSDAARDQFLSSKGIETVRLRSLDLFDENGILHAKAVEKIQGICQMRSGRMPFETKRRRTRKNSGPSSP